MSEPASYELLDVLGEGGMGRVYRALHRPSGAEVAIKTLHSDYRRDRYRRRLLLDEATAAAKLDHPRIVRLLDVGRDRDDTPFLVMELARGEPLDRLVAPWVGFDRIRRALLDVLEGLAAAHAAGIVHRDLKLGNVIVDPEGSARILDFGVATLLDPLKESETGAIVGTPEYMAPEQLSGDGPVGPWTDLYAFGVMLAQIIRGGSPFADFEGLAPLLIAKSTHVPDPSASARAGLGVPRALQELIERLLRPHPRARPRFAVEVAAELSGLLGEIADSVPRGGPMEREDSVQPTTVDPSYVDPSYSDGACSEGEVLDGRSVELALPAYLPGPSDLALGAGIARLREIPIVGRAEERAELAALVEEVVEQGGTRLLAYVGEAGIGKSRLARWGLEYVEQTGTMEGAAGGYDPSGADVAGGLRHALRRVVGMPARGVAEAWRWLAAEPGLDLDRLARFLRAGDDEDTVSSDLVVHLASSALRAAARMRPIYLWLDDLGWARDGALDLVEALLDRDEVPLLIVATMRAGSIQHAGVRARIERVLRHPRARRREVKGLGTEERARLLEQVAPLAPGVARTLAQRIDGSPLLLVQLVHDWRARGLLERHGATHRPRGGASVDALLVERPLAGLMTDRVDDLLSAFDRGAAVAEAVLGRAALLGARFEHEALRFACARDPKLSRAVDEVLDRALLVGVLRAEGQLYAFDHGLVQEALVTRIERGADRTLALVDAANGLLSRYGKERADIAALVAGLLHRAGDRERAWERQLRAIERAAWASDDAAALSYLAVAKSWVAAEPTWAPRAEHAEARVHYFALRYDRALVAIARARSMVAEGSLMAMLCDATEADVLYYQDRFADAERIAQRCLTAASASEDPEVLGIRAQASQRMAELSLLRGDIEKALAWREETLSCAEATGESWRVRVARLNVADLLLVLGRTDEALAICDAMLAEAKAERDRDNVVAASEQRAHMEVLLGRGAPLREYLEQRAAELEASSDAWRLAGLLPYTTLVALELDEDEPSVEARVRRLLGVYRNAPHEEACTIAAMRKLAVALEERGRFDLARELDALLEERAERHRAGFESS